ncbi:MAG TPA: hypothetical protein VK524_18885 [Polyangiaceae bacterium]|nr:hypothetical protein [Polyangiaceae bacterium]
MTSRTFAPSSISVVALLGALLVPRSVQAEDTARACVDHHFQAQVAQRKGALLEAHALLRACAALKCPGVVRDDCAALNAAVLAATPTISPAAVDADGRDLPNATVRVDEDPKRWGVAGRALPVNPGRHTLTFEAEGYRPSSIAAALREGETLRPILMRMERIEEASMWERAHPLAYVFGGLGVVSAGFWAGLSGSGLAKRGTCNEHDGNSRCEDDANQRLLIGDIAGAISVASLATGAYFFFIHPGRSVEPNADRAARPALRFNPRVDTAHAGVWLDGSF